MQDKRRYHRINEEVPLNFVALPDKRFIPGTTINIGGMGIAFSTQEQLTARQELLLYLNLPKKKKAEVHVKIVRVEKKEGQEQRVAVHLMDPVKFDENDFVKFYAEKLNTTYPFN